MQRIRWTAILAVIFWTLAVLGSVAWNVFNHRQNMRDTARNVARAYAEKDALWRSWNLHHGKIYVPVTPTNQPDEHLAHLPHRNLTISPDFTLTLVHVPTMFAQVRGLLDDNHQHVVGQLKSMQPMGPGMIPDPWEKKAFTAMLQNGREFSEIQAGEDGEQVRFLMPLFADASCLEARAEQGLSSGDIVAGISYTLPLAPFWAQARLHLITEWVAHCVFWLLGIAGIFIGFRGMRAHLLGRMAAEDQSRQAYAELQQIFDSTGNAIRIIAPDYTVQRVNRAFATLTGLGVEQVVGHKCYEVFDCPHCNTSECCTRRVFETWAPVRCEVDVIHANGEKRHCDLTASPYFDPSGRLLGVIQDFNDISERQTALEQLRKAEGQWERTFMAIGDVVTIQDTDMRIVRVNQAGCELFGLPSEELVGRKCYEIFRGVSEPCLGCPELEALQNKAPHLAEITHAALGKTFTVSASPILDDENEVIGLIHIAKDITSQKGLEEQIRQGQKMEAVGTLASGVAHDFNNLLTGISGYTQLILQDATPDSQMAADLDEVLKLTQRSADLTQQLLAFSRKQPIKPVALNPNKVVQGVAKMLQRLLTENIALKLELDERAGFISADAGQLEQVIINLAVNARDAMPTGGTLRIATELLTDTGECPECRQEHDAGSFVRILIEDTGKGMDKATQERIFDPFFTTKDLGKGTGLGLSTVYGIVRQHHGCIRVKSEPGKGTTFSLHFPSISAEENALRPPQATSKKPHSGAGTILLVEDEGRLIPMLDRILKEHGYQVITAQHPREALALFRSRKNNIDLLLTDVVMPDMNGNDLFGRLSIEKPQLKVLFMSGYTDDIITPHGILSQDTPFLQKPFTASQLLEAVQRTLGEEELAEGA